MSTIQQNQFSKLVKSNIFVQDPSKVTSKYELSHCEKRIPANGLNFSLPPKYLDYADYLVNFELFRRYNRNLHILPSDDLDFEITRTKETSLSFD